MTEQLENFDYTKDKLSAYEYHWSQVSVYGRTIKLNTDRLIISLSDSQDFTCYRSARPTCFITMSE
mgnify:CR=1 FL=1